MIWDLSSDRPIYTQLIEQIELKICTGVYKPGTKMPSVRDLATQASVNPNTMQRALTGLQESGLLYSQRTAGRFVTEDTNLIKKTRAKLAKEHIEQFIINMSELGFSSQEIIEILTETARGNKE